MSLTQLEQMLLVAILENSEEQHAAAQEYSTIHNFSQDQVNTACKKVTTFLTRQGVTTMLLSDRKALIKLQSFFRMLLVRKKLRKDMQYWERLAKSDCVDHIKKAEKIYKVINRPKKRRKMCLHI